MTRNSYHSMCAFCPKLNTSYRKAFDLLNSDQHYGHTINRSMADELTKHKEKKLVKLAWE